MLDPCAPRAGLLSSIMFLHALLFFLLATSVFASSARTKPARVGVSHPQYQPKVEAGDDTVGVWYPIEGVGV